MYITCSWTTGFLLDLNGSSHLEKDCPGQATTVMYTPVLWPQDRTKFFFYHGKVFSILLQDLQNRSYRITDD